MSQRDNPAILARAASASSAVSERRVPTRGAEVSIPPDADPEAVLDEIRRLITDHLLVARRLAARAASRFPDHAGISNAHRILNLGKAMASSREIEPSRDEEYEWLRQAPESLRGQWVALLGSELVGAARTLAELVELLRSKNLERQALVHRLNA